MKKILCACLGLLVAPILFSQNCTEIFSINIPQRQIIFENKTNKLYGISTLGFTVTDYITGNIVNKGSFKPEEKHFAEICDATGNVIVSDYGHTIYSVDTEKGNTVWQHADFKNIQYRLIGNNYILVFDKEKPKFPITCIDSRTGEKLWQKENMNNLITKDLIIYFGDNVFITDNESSKSKITTHIFTFFSSKTGEPILNFNLQCNKTLFYTDYQLSVINNAFYFIQTDTAGTFVTKVDILKKEVAWSHKIKIPFVQISSRMIDGSSKIRSDIELEIRDSKACVKTNYGFEILDDETGKPVIYKQFPKRSKEYFDMKWVANSAKTLLADSVAYVPYFINKEQFISKFKGSVISANFFLKKLKLNDTSELWTTDLGERLFLKKIYQTKYGILVQFGGIIRSVDGLEPYPSYTLMLLNDKTGEVLWTKENLIDNIYSVAFEGIYIMYLFTSQSIIKINLLNGVEIYSEPFNVIKYITSKDQYGKSIIRQNDLDSYFIDIEEKILIYYPSNSAKITGYKFE